MIKADQLTQSINNEKLWLCQFSFWPSEKVCEPKFYQCKYLDQINYNLINKKIYATVTLTFDGGCSATDVYATFNEFNYDHKKSMYNGVFNSIEDAKKCFIETMKNWSKNMFQYEKENQNND